MYTIHTAYGILIIEIRQKYFQAHRHYFGISSVNEAIGSIYSESASNISKSNDSSTPGHAPQRPPRTAIPHSSQKQEGYCQRGLTSTGLGLPVAFIWHSRQQKFGSCHIHVYCSGAQAKCLLRQYGLNRHSA